MLELPDVPRPVVAAEELYGLLAYGLLAQRGEGVQKVSGKERDVLGTLPQRRNVDGDDIDAIKEIFSEPSGLDQFLKVLIRGREDPDVDLPLPSASNPEKPARLDDPQEF